MERVDFFHPFQDRLIGHGMRLGKAQEVGAAFHYRYFPIGREMFLEERDVLLVELLLKGLRGGGNDDAAAAGDSGQKIS